MACANDVSPMSAMGGSLRFWVYIQKFYFRILENGYSGPYLEDADKYEIMKNR
jgi:hypothetical protein